MPTTYTMSDDPLDFPKAAIEADSLMDSLDGEPDHLDKSLEAANAQPSSNDQTDAAKPEQQADDTLCRLLEEEEQFSCGAGTPMALDISLKLAKQLSDDYRKTDEMINQLLDQAIEVNQRVLLQGHLLGQTRMVRDLEAEYSGNNIYILLEGKRNECDSVKDDIDINTPRAVAEK